MLTLVKGYKVVSRYGQLLWSYAGAYNLFSIAYPVGYVIKSPDGQGPIATFAKLGSLGKFVVNDVHCNPVLAREQLLKNLEIYACDMILSKHSELWYTKSGAIWRCPNVPIGTAFADAVILRERLLAPENILRSALNKSDIQEAMRYCDKEMP